MFFSFKSAVPKRGAGCFIHPTAAVVGDVRFGSRCSVWLNASIRADLNRIVIGEGSNVQDNAALHVAKHAAVKVGKHVSIGHSAVVHGCTIGDNTVVGMGAIILNGARIGTNCLIAAGALVTENVRIPAGALVMGVPGKVVRRLSKAEIRALKTNALEYIQLAQSYRGK